jgi:dolichol kinase
MEDPTVAGPSLGVELARKAIHAATIAVPIIVWFLPAPLALVLLMVGVVAALAIEWARFELRWARFHFLSRTRRLLRHSERRRISGATYMAIAYLGVFILFPTPVAVAAMLYVAVGDAVAALVGRRWGRHRTGWGKSWEGAGAGFAVNLAVGAAIPGLPPIAALLGAFAASTLEFLPLPLDDNLRVALGGGLAAFVGLLLAGTA